MIHHPSSFSIKTHTADEEKIKRMELGNCIQTYMLNPIVKDTAERAGWLGNDETHYLRKWEEKDLQDLKDLLQLVVTALHTELQYHKMKKDMLSLPIIPSESSQAAARPKRRIQIDLCLCDVV
jgi:iron-sulfur cluster repair protein YtfE (RIC family)